MESPLRFNKAQPPFLSEDVSPDKRYSAESSGLYPKNNIACAGYFRYHGKEDPTLVFTMPGCAWLKEIFGYRLLSS
jgi:hypothetical protein